MITGDTYTQRQLISVFLYTEYLLYYLQTIETFEAICPCKCKTVIYISCPIEPFIREKPGTRAMHLTDVRPWMPDFKVILPTS